MIIIEQNILLEEVNKIKEKLKPYIISYIAEFIPSDKIPENNKGRFYCFNHHNTGKMDTSADMQYYPESGTFHCFSCGANYDIWKLANFFEGKPLKGKEFFTDTVKYLAKKYGIDTTQLDEMKIGNEEIKLTEFYYVIKEISNYITNNVNEKFLEARKISKESSKLFNVGSIKDIDDFKKFISQFKEETLKELGILFKKDGNLNTNVFDRTKLIFTIKNTNGTPVGFSSREMIFNVSNAKKLLKKNYNYNDKVLENIKSQKDLEGLINLNFNKKHIDILKKCVEIKKYMLTPESPIFKKRECLYGFYEVKNKLNNTLPLTIIEGNVDVITAFQKGIYCVSVGGDKITDEQFDFLERIISSKYTNKINIMFDNDNAGKEATYKLVKEKILKQDTLLNKYFISKYKDGALKDLDENLKIGKELEDISDFINLFDYYIEEELIRNDKQEEDVIQDVVKLISSEEEPFKRKRMISNLDNLLEKISIEKDRERIISLKDIEAQVNYITNKIEVRTQNIVKKELETLKKDLLNLKPDNLEYKLENFKKNIIDKTENLSKKKKSIFDLSIENLEINEEKKYTEEPMSINFGYDLFEDRSWTGSEYIVLLAKPHVGKTQFMTNITRNLIQLNPNTAILYISTDDNARKIQNNFISQIGNLNKDFVNEPKNNKYYGLNSINSNKMMLQEEYRRAFNELRRYMISKRLVILDSANDIKNLDNVITYINEFCSDKDIKDLKKIVIFDSANKITIPGINEEYAHLTALSNTIKSVGQNNDCIMFANFEVKKSPSRRIRTMFSSVKGSGAMEYDADIGIALNNPLSELESPNCYWYKDGQLNFKQAVLVPYVLKSKIGGTLHQAHFYKIINDNSLILEPDEDEKELFKSKWIQDNSDKEVGYRID